MKGKILAFLFAITVFFSNPVRAKEYGCGLPYTGSSIPIGNSITQSMAYFSASNPNWIADCAKHSATGLITLELGERPLIQTALGAQRVTLTVEVKGYYANGTTFSETRTLSVNNSNLPGETPTYRSTLTYPKTYRLVVKVTRTEVDGIPLMIPLPDNLSFNVCVIGEVVRKLNTDTRPTELTTTVELDGQIGLSWPALEGAEEYDLEWAYVNSYYNATLNTPLEKTESTGIALLNVDFEKNSTRVTLKENNYKITNSFGLGYLVIRYRARGFKDNSGQWVYTRWTVDNDPGRPVSSYDSKFRVYLFRSGVNKPLQDNMNWNFSAVYAEEGKRSENLDYADGVLKTHQSVMRSPAINEAIVKEVVYDAFGRQIIDIMPAPAASNSLNFYTNFNNNSSGSPVHYSDLFQTSCGATGLALNSNSGAARYYSPNNDKVQGSPTELDENDYIPNAFGYPYSQVNYLNDQTGRTRTSTFSPGQVYALGGGKEQNSIYSQPDQTELDRIFGTDAGYFWHYKKLITIDPHQQASISYVDLNGKTIATSLVGSSPDNLVALDNNPSGVSDLQRGSFLKNKNDGFSLTSSSTLGVAALQNYTFYYKLDPVTLVEECIAPNSICFNCRYQLVIDIQDDCGGSPSISSSIPQGVYSKLPIKLDVGTPANFSCVSGEPTEIVFSATLPKGSYIVSKKLQLSEDAADEAFKNYIQNSTCVKTEQEFINQELSLVDFSDCYNRDCEQACEELLRSGGTLKQVTECRLSCLAIDPCKQTLEAMKFDVSPGGQYGQYNTDGSTVIDATSVFNISNVFGKSYKSYTSATDYSGLKVTLPDETTKKPWELSVPEFIGYYNPKWAETLVKAHPESACASRCDQLTGTHRYGELMRIVEKHSDAQQMGLFNPLKSAGTPVGAGEPLVKIEQFSRDPFFIPGGPLGPVNSALYQQYYGEMYNYMYNYVLKDPNGTQDKHYTLWQMAVAAGECPRTGDDLVDAACVNRTLATGTYPATYFPETPDECGSQSVWLIFKGLYLSKRQELVNRYMYSASCNAAVPTGKSRRFINSQTAFFDAFNFDPYATGAVENAQSKVNVNQIVNTNCDSYIAGWLNSLSGCNPVANSEWSAGNTYYDRLAAKLKEVCILGGDEQHLIGASSVSPANAGGTVPEGYKTFQDVIVGVMGQEALLCNANLITRPLAYGIGVEAAEGIGVADDCACQELLLARQVFRSGVCMPDNIKTLEQYIAYKYGVKQPNADYIACRCDKAYQDLHGGEAWTENATWPANAKQVIASYIRPAYPVNNYFKCQPCITCSEFNVAYNRYYNYLVTSYGYGPETPASDESSVNRMMLNHLTREFKTEFTDEKVNYMMSRCRLTPKLGGVRIMDAATPQGSPQGPPSPQGSPEEESPEEEPDPNDPYFDKLYCREDTYLIYHFEKLLNQMAGRKNLDGQACLCKAPYNQYQTSDFSGANSHYTMRLASELDFETNMYECNHTYQYGDYNQTTKTHHGRIFDEFENECVLTFYFPDHPEEEGKFDLYKIAGFKKLTADFDQEHYFLRGIAYDGYLNEYAVEITSSCMTFYSCYSPGGQTPRPYYEACVRIPGLEEDENTCEKDKKERAIRIAMEKYVEYKDELATTFKQRYAAAC
ncbi:MAG: hypothetical protein V4616_09885, partial [Bacteroidota bacterium]